MNKHVFNSQTSETREKLRESKKKDTEEERSEHKRKPGKHRGKDETTLGELNNSSKKPMK